MEKILFGTLPSGEAVHKYTVSNGEITLSVIDFGAAIQSLVAYGVDVVGGFDTLGDYLLDTSHQGATIGRVANRIENARFTMDGREYSLPKNSKGHCLHGGCGFDRRMWTLEASSDTSLTFSYTAEDGEEGFPAKLYTEVSFSLSGGGVQISYKARPDGKTPIALTNHSYFNLNGFGGDVKSHTAKIYAEEYTAVNEGLIPTGEHPKVFGTVFDFTKPHTIGERIGGDFIGYDHNFVLSKKITKEFSGKSLALAAEVFGDALKMSVYTDQPGVQFYIGNFLGSGPAFKGGIPAIRHGAFCLETQTEPNCINHGEGFYGKGDTYTHETVYSFEKLS